MLELALTRRSTRRFTDENISEEQLNKVMNVALLAPSSWGKNPVKFIIVRDKNTLKKLADCKRIGAKPVDNANVAIVVAVDQKDCELWIEDGSVASTYLLLAAEYYGLGACWVHMNGREGKVLSSGEEIQKILGIPNHFGILNIIALGVKGEHKPVRKTIDIKTENLHYEHYRVNPK